MGSSELYVHETGAVTLKKEPISTEPEDELLMEIVERWRKEASGKFK